MRIFVSMVALMCLLVACNAGEPPSEILNLKVGVLSGDVARFSEKKPEVMLVDFVNQMKRSGNKGSWKKIDDNQWIYSVKGKDYSSNDDILIGYKFIKMSGGMVLKSMLWGLKEESIDDQFISVFWVAEDKARQHKEKYGN